MMDIVLHELPEPVKGYCIIQISEKFKPMVKVAKSGKLYIPLYAICTEDMFRID